MAYRRKRTDILQVFRIIHGIDKIPFDQFFSLSNSVTRGHAWKLDKPRANTRLRQHTLSHRVINDWNSLPESVVNCISLLSFKQALEKAWVNDPTKYVFN